MCNRLRSLRLSNTNFGVSSGSQPHYLLADHLSNLESLYLVDCQSVDKFLGRVASAAGSRLRRLNVCGSDVSSESLGLVALHCRNLERLNIASTSRISWNAWSVIGKLTSLRSLNVHRASPSSDLTAPFADLLPQLRRVRKLVTLLATDQMLDLIARNLPLLEDFRCDASRLQKPTATLRALCAGCPLLRRLDLVGLGSTAPANEKLEKAVESLSSLAALEHIDLSASLIDDNTFEILCKLLKPRALILDSCRHLSDQALVRLAKQPRPHLHHLAVGQSKTINFDPLVSALFSCPNLVRLKCSSSEKIGYRMAELRKIALLRTPICRIE